MRSITRLTMYLSQYVRCIKLDCAAPLYDVVCPTITLVFPEHISGQKLWHQRAHWEPPLISLCM